MAEELITDYDTYTIFVTELTSLQTTELTKSTNATPEPDEPFFTARVIMGIAIASAVGLLLLLAILIGVMAYRNKRKLQSNNDDDELSGSSSSNPTTSKDLRYDSAPKREEYSWAYSNGGLDVMGDEGIEVDLDQSTEDRMRHLAATFNSGPYQPKQKRANFDRQSFYADHAANATYANTHGDSNSYANTHGDSNPYANTHGNSNPYANTHGDSNPYSSRIYASEGRPSSFTFFSGDLPTTPL